MRALVTGAVGFIGRHFTARLRADGYRVDAIDTADHSGNVLVTLGDWSPRYDLVVHAAAHTPHRAAIDRDPSMHLYNRHLDTHLFRWAAGTGQPRVLYFSSCAAADPFPDAYGRCKLAGEELALLAGAAGVRVTVVRPYSGYGEDQSTDFPFGAFIDRARRRADPFDIWGNGRQVRDWIHVDDIVEESLMAVHVGVAGPVSLCTGVGTSMLDVARMVCTEAGYAPAFRLRGDKSAGADRRVGTPALSRRKITLEEGIRRALHG